MACSKRGIMGIQLHPEFSDILKKKNAPICISPIIQVNNINNICHTNFLQCLKGEVTIIVFFHSKWRNPSSIVFTTTKPNVHEASVVNKRFCVDHTFLVSVLLNIF